jgi:hypothetical protein
MDRVKQTKQVQVFEGTGRDYDTQQFVSVIIKGENRSQPVQGIIPKAIFELLVSNMDTTTHHALESRYARPIYLVVYSEEREENEPPVYEAYEAVLQSWTTHRGKDQAAKITAKSVRVLA